MGHFKDDEDVYRFIGRMFQELAADPELVPRLQKANTTVRFEMREGDGQVAETSFVIRDGKIVQWRRVGGGPQAPSQSA